MLLGGTAFAFARGRGDHTPTLEPTARDSVDAGGATAVLERDSATDTDELVDVEDDELVEELVEEPVVVEPEAATFRSRLGKARSAMAGLLSGILSGGDVNAETWDELEEALIRADVGVAASTEILGTVREKADADGVKDPAVLIEMVKDEMKSRLGSGDITLAEGGDPSVWLFVGVNGVGKTTTIGKIATREVAAGRSLVLAAGDTFRAAAAEQLTMWGCLLYTSPSPRDQRGSRMPSSA